jgi:hypothetical protein
VQRSRHVWPMRTKNLVQTCISNNLANFLAVIWSTTHPQPPTHILTCFCSTLLNSNKTVLTAGTPLLPSGAFLRKHATYQTTRRQTMTTETVEVERNAPHFPYKIPGFHRGIPDVLCLLGFYAPLVGSYRGFGTQVQHSTTKILLTPEDGTDTLTRNTIKYQPTLRKTPEKRKHLFRRFISSPTLKHMCKVVFCDK